MIYHDFIGSTDCSLSINDLIQSFHCRQMTSQQVNEGLSEGRK